ncbi:hypothetical protein NFI96_002803 [Prochilodus magdalenae]|nr:hypothetical protein NFI96_002803 [Prochilodus magdalenae]
MASYGGTRSPPAQPHLTSEEGSSLSSPPPLPHTYPSQIKEEVEEDCYYTLCSPSSSSVCDDSGYGTPYGHQQRRSIDPRSSLPVLTSEQVTPSWAQRNDRGSPVQSRWRPASEDALAFNSSSNTSFGSSQAFYCSPPTAPQSTGSHCWDGGPHRIPLASSSFCPQRPKPVRSDQQDRGLHHGPVPELPALSLQEILGELQGDWYTNPEVSCCYKYLMFSYNIIFWDFTGPIVTGIQQTHRVRCSFLVVKVPHRRSCCDLGSRSVGGFVMCVLTTVTFLPQLAGAAFIAIGFWAWSEKGVLLDLTQVTRMHGFDPVWLVLVVGAVTFVLGFAGCVGALRENICLLKFFSGIIGFIFFLELTAAVLAIVFQEPLRGWISEFFLANVKAYRDDIDLQNLIDSLQKLNHCCGAKDPNDWNMNVYFNCSESNPSRERCGVPFSCCVNDPADMVLNTQCGYDIRGSGSLDKWSTTIYTKGCISALEEWLPRNIYIVAGVFIVISLLQMVGIYLARTLIADIEKVKYNPY